MMRSIFKKSKMTRYFAQILVTTLLIAAHVGSISIISKEKALNLLQSMNLTEKITMMHGYPGYYVGNIKGNDRLNIPELKMQDGPQGFRVESSRTGPVGTTTAWPSALSVAASWDVDAMYKWAQAMGLEFKQKGANVFLGPGIGIARVPNAGRNFEYLCGEDPVLGAALVKNVVKGIQDNGIIATAKHFINNEIETDRKKVSANVDERVRFELYYVPFQAAIDAGVLSVMCAYNRINDVSACENSDTLHHLRDDMGFDGWVMSDWLATYSTTPSISAGLDQEMPYDYHYSEKKLEAALIKGDIDLKQIDSSVLRILSAMYESDLFQGLNEGNPHANVTSDIHNQLARELAANSIVLVKNDKVPKTMRDDEQLGTSTLLPLSVGELGACIAVFGDETTVSGGGSGHVTPAYLITPSQGIQNALNGKGIQTKVIYNSGAVMDDAIQLAQQCATSIVVVATSSTEAVDRPTLSLGNNQDELVVGIAKANPRTVVVVNTPGAVLMPWHDQVPSILISWLPGQEAGNAVADVLFGAVNPSGRLPVTMPNKENEVGFTPEQFPGTGNPPESSYIEELLIGYRWYEANDVTPLFPFGYGLSYTSFHYSSLDVRVISTDPSMRGDVSASTIPVTEVSFVVTNTGSLSGSDVPQLYLSFPTDAHEPIKQLKYFKKVALEEKDYARVLFTITKRDVSIWDVDSHNWMLVKGEYTVFIGTSAATMVLSQKMNIN